MSLENFQRNYQPNRVKESHLCMLFICSIYNRRAAHFADFLVVAVKRPAADFLAADHILDEENAAIEA